MERFLGDSFSRILIGTSGWSYEDWLDVFYLSEENMLGQYYKIFKTVEIDSTFYSYPTESMIRGILRSSPRGFVFSAKVPKQITHKKKINPKLSIKQDIKKFLNLMKPLRDSEKLGALLFQLPPISFSEVPYFEKFLDLLSSFNGYRFAIEFRDMSWIKEEVFNELKGHSIAYCIVDEPLLPSVVKITTNFAYIRWHGRGKRPWYYYEYNEDELKAWVPKIKRVSSKAKVVYGYFNNHFRGYAPKNALQMLKLLKNANKEQLKMLKEIERYSLKRSVEKTKLLAEKRKPKDIEDFLSLFLTKGRLERAKSMPDNLVKIKDKGNIIVGKIKDYNFEINLSKKYIYHDCDDWKKVSKSKKFCKHIGKVFLTLPKNRSIVILNKILNELEEWNFRDNA